ncbi:MAG: 30S ribosomal protein S3 [Nanoarchaeota archaeon]
MIERKFIAQNIKEFQIQEYISSTLKNVGHSHTRLMRTPLGEKIIIYTSRPGLIVGRKGENIKKLTKNLKKKFDLENPQIEIAEVDKIMLDPQIVAERIASSLERFGSNRFKGIGHKTMEEVIQSGALGIEIVISGKIPGARAKSWRFYKGYLKKCGNLAMTGVKYAHTDAQLKTGTIGIKVSIMPSDVHFPDKVTFITEETAAMTEKTAKKEETAEEKPAEQKSSTEKETPKKARKPRATKKKAEKSESKTSSECATKEETNGEDK